MTNLQVGKNSKAGFTLVELSIVLVVLALIISGVIVFVSGLQEEESEKITHEKIEKIQNALYAYTSQNGLLPCPAKRNDAFGSANFGVATDCTASEATACGNDADECVVLNDGTYQEVRIGVLPVRSLGLNDEYMFDGYGNRYTYAVPTELTLDATSVENFKTLDTNGIIQIQDGTGNSIITAPTECSTIIGGAKHCPVTAYTIISHGENALGSYDRVGNQTACVTTTDEGENCDDTDAIFVDKFTNDGNAAGDNYYDDIIAWENLVMLKGKLTESFSPLSLKPSLWLDANDKYSIFDTNTSADFSQDTDDVGRWEDKSGNSRHMIQTTLGNRPNWNTGVKNGLAGINFIGTDANSLESIANIDISGTQNRTIITVLKNPTGSAAKYITSWGSGAAGALDGITAEYYFRHAGVGGTKSYSGVGVDGDWEIIAKTSTGGTLSDFDLYLNNALQTPVTTPTTAINTANGAIMVGCGTTAPTATTNCFEGYITEVLVFDYALDTNQMAEIHNYLMDKWGITP